MAEAMAVMAVLFAGVGGCFAACMVQGLLQSARNHERAMDNAGDRMSLARRLARDGVVPLAPLAERLLRLGFVRVAAVKLRHAAVVKGVDASTESVTSLTLAALSVAGVLGAALTGSVVFGAMAACCLYAAATIWAGKVLDAEESLLHDQLPDALQAMRGCFNVGCSIPQMFGQVAREVDDPLSRLFQRAEAVVETGGTVEEALEEMKRDSRDDELGFVATALEIQHRTGSGMQQVLQATLETVQDELALRRSLKTQTAQAKLSAQIVSVMPFLLIAVFSMVSPGFLDPFFESALGLLLLAAAAGMQVAGVLAVRRTLRFGEV